MRMRSLLAAVGRLSVPPICAKSTAESPNVTGRSQAPHAQPDGSAYGSGVEPVVRRSRPGDDPWIVEVIDRHRGVGLAAKERARQGFVQGRWSLAVLASWPRTPGIVVAEVDGARAGVAISSPPGTVETGPAGRTNELAAQRFGPNGYFLYGPAVVEDPYRRRGVLAAMVDRLFQDASGDYSAGVAFIEDVNAASKAAHRRLGFAAFATFGLDGRSYECLWRPTGPTAGCEPASDVEGRTAT